MAENVGRVESVEDREGRKGRDYRDGFMDILKVGTKGQRMEGYARTSWLGG